MLTPVSFSLYQEYHLQVESGFPPATNSINIFNLIFKTFLKAWKCDLKFGKREITGKLCSAVYISATHVTVVYFAKITDAINIISLVLLQNTVCTLF